MPEALQVANHGMTLEHGHRTALATWVRDHALALGQAESALAAALVLVRTHPVVVTNVLMVSANTF